MQINSARLRVFSTVLALTISALTSVRAATPDVLGFLFKIGPATVAWGYGDSEFVLPTGLAVGGPDNRIYVSDLESDQPSHRVRVFGSDGAFAFSFGGVGCEAIAPETSPPNGKLCMPMGLAVDDTGKLLVADTWNHRLQLFQVTGTTATWLKSVGSEGNFDPIDPVNLDEFGTYVGPMPTPGAVELSFPTRVAVRPHTRLNDSTDLQGRIAVLDQGNHRVVVLSSTFAPLFTFGAFGRDGNAIGEFEYPFSVAIDNAGNIYVADPLNHRIQIFDQFGSPKRVFGSQGASNLPGDLQTPYDAQPHGNGGIIVTDSDRSRILILVEDPAVTLTPRCSDVPAAAAAGRCAIVASDGTRYDARVLGRAGLQDGEFAWPAAAAVDGVGRVAVADTENHRLQMFQAATLQIASAVGTPGTVNSGQSVTLNVTVQNTGGMALANVIATATPSLGGVLTPLSPAANIPAGGTASFAFTFVTDESGTLTFAVKATGQTATGAPVAAQPFTTTPGISVTAAAGPKLFATITATPSHVEHEGVITVQVTLKNTGNVSLSNVTPSVDVSPAGLATLLTQPPADPKKLAPNASRTFAFTYKASATVLGDVTFRPGATATYTGGSYTLPVAPQPAATVTIVGDARAPVTQLAVSGTVGTNGWYRSAIHVVLTATDNVAVAAISYEVAGVLRTGDRVPGSSAEFDVGTQDFFQGGVDVTYWAEDAAGNREPKQTRHFNIDWIAPQIFPAGVVPKPNDAGWVTQAPTVSFRALDGESGIASLTAPKLLPNNGANQVVVGKAVDFAGNEAETSITVSVDKAPPTVTCAATTAPNSLGWYTSGSTVTVNCTAADQAGLSGMLSLRALCPGNPVQGTTSASCSISTEGVHTVIGEAKDVAGNLAVVTLVIKIDRTPPGMACGTASGGQIWPPNHQMVPWNTSVLVTDLVSGSGGVRLIAYSSSEAENWKGDGNTKVDMTGWTPNPAPAAPVFTPTAGVTSGYVRAERSGPGTGRIYRLLYEGMDQAGNVTACTVVLTAVPHDQGKK